jgi:hypothetical protein
LISTNQNNNKKNSKQIILKKFNKILCKTHLQAVLNTATENWVNARAADLLGINNEYMEEIPTMLKNSWVGFIYFYKQNSVLFPSFKPSEI